MTEQQLDRLPPLDLPLTLSEREELEMLRVRVGRLAQEEQLLNVEITLLKRDRNKLLDMCEQLQQGVVRAVKGVKGA